MFVITIPAERPSDPLGDWLKAAQIAFYVASILFAVLTVGTAILTYRAVKRGWLNPIFTEYQKEVVTRLKKLSDDLFSEIDPGSERYARSGEGVKDAVRIIQAQFNSARDEILKLGEWGGWIILPRDTLHMAVILEPVKSDPFIPAHIRDAVVKLLEPRKQAFEEAAHEALQDYQNTLAQGVRPPLEDDWIIVANAISAAMASRGSGPVDVEAEIHRIRGMIRTYFEGFDPHGGGGIWRWMVSKVEGYQHGRGAKPA